MNRTRIFSVHLLNDRSGSPFVFRQALEALIREGYSVELFTSTPSGDGFLSGVAGVRYHRLAYRHHRIPVVTLLRYLWVQLNLFIRLVTCVRSGDIVYINSMLPFGAALAGRMRRCRVIYHLHEISIRPDRLKRWLIWVIDHTACHCLFVSRYLMEQLPVRCPGTVIYNALPRSFLEKATGCCRAGHEPFTVLMACSLKDYKGIWPFIQLAGQLNTCRFELVLNAGQRDIRRYLGELPPSDNLAIYEAQADMHPFYKRASVVVNFSLPDQWIETFGMTALEAQSYGRPVIVPAVGGIMELVDHGINGFRLDSRMTGEVLSAIRLLAGNKEVYARMSEAARLKARRFTPCRFDRQILKVFHDAQHKNSTL